MKSIYISFFFVIPTLLATNSFGCNVEMGSADVQSVVLNQGIATLSNDETGRSILITCGEFKGTVDGIERIINLQPNSCSVINSMLSVQLFECR